MTFSKFSQCLVDCEVGEGGLFFECFELIILSIYIWSNIFSLFMTVVGSKAQRIPSQAPQVRESITFPSLLFYENELHVQRTLSKVAFICF